MDSQTLADEIVWCYYLHLSPSCILHLVKCHWYHCLALTSTVTAQPSLTWTNMLLPFSVLCNKLPPSFLSSCHDLYFLVCEACYCSFCCPLSCLFLCPYLCLLFFIFFMPYINSFSKISFQAYIPWNAFHAVPFCFLSSLPLPVAFFLSCSLLWPLRPPGSVLWPQPRWYRLPLLLLPVLPFRLPPLLLLPLLPPPALHSAQWDNPTYLLNCFFTEYLIAMFKYLHVINDVLPLLRKRIFIDLLHMMCFLQ